ncbi:MAG TPA: hypothetical protein VF322_05940 [Gammaproteobacteria bacterium]
MEPFERDLADGRQRFDGASVRRILERAAREQHRLDRARRDSYSLAELEHMAAQARISPEALRAALRAEAAHARTAPAARRAAGRRIPDLGSPGVQVALFAGTGLALFGLMLAFPVVAYTFLWASAVVSLLLLLGASPF